MAYMKGGSRAGSDALNNASKTILKAEGFGEKSLAVHPAAKITAVNVTGGTTTDTTVKFYKGTSLIKTITSDTGVINDTAPGITLEKHGVNKVVLGTTGDHTLSWSLTYEAI